MELQKYKKLYGDRVLVKRLEKVHYIDQKLAALGLVSVNTNKNDFVMGVITKIGVAVDADIPQVGDVVMYSQVAATSIPDGDELGMDMISGKSIMAHVDEAVFTEVTVAEISKIRSEIPS